ncbi:MAG: hypothetical protein A2X86_15775 [Bdellovibrionales bacterium GWA2_49_15]|nr:MAG: hypothetical protein A2X86_15775 [Bdellovibrionales bacterium GWA2_49_15]HAZ12395.1 hypothetical protein [Bdellovibrionales bacterium]
MQEIQTLSIPFSWPNCAVSLAWGALPKSAPNLLEWQRSLARLSLKAGGTLLGHDLPSPTVLDYKRIEGKPELTCSLSHTGGPGKSKDLAVGASLLSTTFMTTGVGIDLEWNDRPMREGAYRRFRHEGDHSSWEQADQLLWTWMVKEACFKAASNTWGDAITLINQIRLGHAFLSEGCAEAYDSAGGYLGDLLYRLITLDCAGHGLNIALAKK